METKKEEVKQKTVEIDLADTETIKNVLIKADREHRQYMIFSSLEVWDNIDILVKSILASINYLVDQGENKKEVFDKMIKFFEEDVVYKVQKKTNEIPTA